MGVSIKISYLPLFVCVKESGCLVGFASFSFVAPLLFLRVCVPARAVVRVVLVGWSRWASCPCLLSLESAVFSSSFASVVSGLAPVGPVSVLAPVVVPPVAPAFVGFVPAALRVGGRVVSSSRFLPVVSGVVSSLSWDAGRGAVVAVVGGHRLLCLSSGLGGVGSPDAVALVAALRVARSSGAPVQVWGAPGSSGCVCPGYFCGVSAA